MPDPTANEQGSAPAVGASASPWEGPGPAGASPARLLRTVAYLRPGQIVGQLRQRLRRALEDPARATRSPAPPAPDVRWQPTAAFLPPGPRLDSAALARGEFRFLGVTREIGWPPRWPGPHPSRLWEYNLHYFDYLWWLDPEAAQGVVLDWIREHPAGRGRAGWEPYPTSLRTLNWCAFFLGDDGRRSQLGASFRAALWASLYHQLEWLNAHLETHLLGNHLLENAFALALCGSAFDGPDAQRWRSRGLAILRRELPEQVLADGGHFERAPMYHVRVTWGLATLLATGDVEVAAVVREPLQRLTHALAALSHPDGEIALFNDSAVGIYPTPGEVASFAARALGVPVSAAAAGSESFQLPDTGYFGARSGDGHHIVCDAGPIGPDYLPGHSHADIFSFELSLQGRRVITDAGVFGYEPDALRRYCRSTRAHNTVELNGEDQCEMWSVFRVARRGRPRDVRFEVSADGFELSGWHDGYERLPGSPRHSREFRWQHRGVLQIRDWIESRQSVSAVSRFHLHPDCQIEDLADDLVTVRHPGGSFWVAFAGRGRLGVERSMTCPGFGVAIPTRALVYSAEATGEGGIELGFCVAGSSGDDARTLSQSLLHA